MKITFTKKLLFLLFVSLINTSLSKVIAQVAIAADSTRPDSSAMLDIRSTKKGMLVPRLDYFQRISIVKPSGWIACI